MHKTSREDIRYFSARVNHWARVLSLGDWKIETYIGKTDNNSAECEMWHNAHGARIRLKETFSYKPGKHWLDRLALHEVSHVMLCDFKRLIGEKITTDAMIETAEHAIIRRLENAFLPEAEIRRRAGSV